MYFTRVVVDLKSKHATMQFEDIVMLDIPDDPFAYLSSDERPVSEGLDPENRPTKREYPKLQLWLLNDSDLEFNFDQKLYSDSVSADDEFSNAQAHYVTLIYKIVADLVLKGVDSPLSIEEEKDYIGVVSSNSRDMGRNKNEIYKLTLINDAFSKIFGEFRAFVDLVKDSVSNDEAVAFEDLMSIFDCLEATCFAPSERNRPELILLWINNYDPQPENDFINSVMYNTPTPYKHSQFWTLYLGTLLLRGLFQQAESSLRSSKFEELAKTCSDLHSIIEDFTTLVGTYTSMALKGQFPEWKYTVCEFRDNFKTMKNGISDPVHVTIASQIHDLLCLMSGLPKSTAMFVSTWYEMYGASSLYQVRDESDVYEDYYKLAIHEKGIDIDSPLDEIFRNILEKNYLQVVLLIHDLDAATAAYLSKLFELRGFFSSYYIGLTEQRLLKHKPVEKRCVSDYLLTRHAFECLEVHKLVPVAMGILLTPLITCLDAEQKRNMIKTFLPNYQCLTNDDLEWALTICTKVGLPEVVRSLLLKRGERSLQEGYLYEAMNSLVACFDERRESEESVLAMNKIHNIVWDILFQDVLLNSSPVPDELLNNIVTDQVDSEFPVNPVIRQCIAPFAVLTEFFLSISDESQMQKNISRLFHLLKFKYLPFKFIPLLLSQFLPLLTRAKFEMQHFVIMIDLLDSFELQQLQRQNSEDADDLYEYAISILPENNKYDWRVWITESGLELPPTVDELSRVLRQRIMGKIGKGYIGA